MKRKTPKQTGGGSHGVDKGNTNIHISSIKTSAADSDGVSSKKEENGDINADPTNFYCIPSKFVCGSTSSLPSKSKSKSKPRLPSQFPHKTLQIIPAKMRSLRIPVYGSKPEDMSLDAEMGRKLRVEDVPFRLKDSASTRSRSEVDTNFAFHDHAGASNYYYASRNCAVRHSRHVSHSSHNYHHVSLENPTQQQVNRSTNSLSTLHHSQTKSRHASQIHSCHHGKKYFSSHDHTRIGYSTYPTNEGHGTYFKGSVATKRSQYGYYVAKDLSTGSDTDKDTMFSHTTMSKARVNVPKSSIEEIKLSRKEYWKEMMKKVDQAEPSDKDRSTDLAIKYAGRTNQKPYVLFIKRDSFSSEIGQENHKINREHGNDFSGIDANSSARKASDPMDKLKDLKKSKNTAELVDDGFHGGLNNMVSRKDNNYLNSSNESQNPTVLLTDHNISHGGGLNNTNINVSQVPRKDNVVNSRDNLHELNYRSHRAASTPTMDRTSNNIEAINKAGLWSWPSSCTDPDNISVSLFEETLRVTRAFLRLFSHCLIELRHEMLDNKTDHRSATMNTISDHNYSYPARFPDAPWHTKYGLQALITDVVFEDFQTESFGVSTYTEIQYFRDRMECRRAFWNDFRRLSDVSSLEAINVRSESYDEKLHHFCTRKQRSMELSKLEWLGRSWPETLTESFVDAMKYVWQTHLLAFSFKDPASIFHAQEGANFDPFCMEAMNMMGSSNSKHLSSIVDLMVAPGFELPDRIIKSQVCLRPLSYVSTPHSLSSS